jgi:hypothetical protein
MTRLRPQGATDGQSAASVRVAGHVGVAGVALLLVALAMTTQRTPGGAIPVTRSESVATDRFR